MRGSLPVMPLPGPPALTKEGAGMAGAPEEAPPCAGAGPEYDPDAEFPMLVVRERGRCSGRCDQQGWKVGQVQLSERGRFRG